MNKVRKKDSERESVRLGTAFIGHPDVQVSLLRGKTRSRPGCHDI